MSIKIFFVCFHLMPKITEKQKAFFWKMFSTAIV